MEVHELMQKYEIIIYWSDEDALYVAEVSELTGCTAHGERYEEALQSIQEAMALWLEVADEFGDPKPEPLPRPLLPAWQRPVCRHAEPAALEAAG